MDELIARLEAAPEGSRELDTSICHALGGCGDDGGRTCPGLCPSFTTSLDVALSLVPEGWHIDCLTTGDKGTRPENPAHWCQCIIRPFLGNDAGWEAIGVCESRMAHTPATALVIAALKAIAAMQKEGGEDE